MACQQERGLFVYKLISLTEFVYTFFLVISQKFFKYQVYLNPGFRTDIGICEWITPNYNESESDHLIGKNHAL